MHQSPEADNKTLSVGNPMTPVARAPAEKRRLWAHPWVLWSLAAVYLFWGTSYLAIKQAGDDFPPMLLVGLRNVLAGGLMLLLAWGTKRPFGKVRETLHASVVGVLMIAVGASLLAMGIRYVDSGVAAMVFATVPVVVCLLMAVLGSRIGVLQWAGTLVGASGLLLLNAGTEGSVQTWGLCLILGAVVATAASAILMDRWAMPSDLLVATGVQMLAGGGVACVLGFMWGERIGEISSASWLAWLYLSLMVSVLGYLSYTYLLLKTGPILASSYAYVNPPIALLAGAILLGETVTVTGYLSMGLVLLAALLVLWGTPTKTALRRAVSHPLIKQPNA